QDWLGTVRATANNAGGLVDTFTSWPYGANLSQVGIVSNDHFTDKYHDGESGIDYFGARYYSSTLGRFLTPDPDSDPSPLKLVDPQRWNMYAYALNNPTNFTDPTGMDAIAVNFSGMVLGLGHEAIVSVNPDGTAEFATFGPTEQTMAGGWGLNEPGEVGTNTDLPRVYFDADGQPTAASIAALKMRLAGIEGVDPNTVRLNYFKTSSGETASLNAWIAQQKANAGRYEFCTRNCADFTARGLVAGGAITQSQADSLSIDPNLVFQELSLLADESTQTNQNGTVSVTQCETYPDGTQHCTNP
ncbi:MAG: RHS repeat-associated core domain-containing protein, partial [bacterium]